MSRPGPARHQTPADRTVLAGTGGERMPYADLPGEVREAVDAALGVDVVDAETQGGGFSPGVASRVTTADGRRAFVKAVDADVNDVSRRMFEQEAAVLSCLPHVAWRPELVDLVTVGSWVALVLDDVDGVTPSLPWEPDELGRVLGAIETLAAVPAHDLDSDLLRPAADRHDGIFGHWQRVLDDGFPTGRAWADEHVEVLVEAEAGWEDAVAGDRLLHGDLRADNVVLTADRVVLVDWPHAAVGHPLFDAVGLAPSVAMQGGPQPEELLGAMAHTRDVPPEQLRPVVVGVAGYFARNAMLPPPPGIPAVRAFQAAQADVAVPWARRCLEA